MFNKESHYNQLKYKWQLWAFYTVYYTVAPDIYKYNTCELNAMNSVW